MIKLRKIDKNDIPYMLEWMHDDEINCQFRIDFASMTAIDVEKYIERSMLLEENGEEMHRAIVDESNQYLGTVSLKSIDKISKNAEYAICLRKCAQGKNIAALATREILKIAFEEIDLDRVYLNVLSDNIKANLFYQKIGFVFEGEFRYHVMIHGELKNLKWYSVLKNEYYYKYPKLMLSEGEIVNNDKTNMGR